MAQLAWLKWIILKFFFFSLSSNTPCHLQLRLLATLPTAPANVSAVAAAQPTSQTDYSVGRSEKCAAWPCICVRQMEHAEERFNLSLTGEQGYVGRLVSFILPVIKYACSILYQNVLLLHSYTRTRAISPTTTPGCPLETVFNLSLGAGEVRCTAYRDRLNSELHCCYTVFQGDTIIQFFS
jgi:hypothetical protein